LAYYLRNEGKYGNGLIGGGCGQKKLDSAPKVRSEIGEIVWNAIRTCKHQRRRSEDLRGIALGFQVTVTLRAVALDDSAHIDHGADESRRETKIEMSSLADGCDCTTEQMLVDEDADNRLLAGAIGRDHDIEQKACRARFGRKAASIDDSNKIGSAEYICLHGRDLKLLEGHTVGRKIDRHCLANRCPRNAAGRGPQRTRKQATRAYDITVGDEKRRRTTYTYRSERTEWLDGAGHPCKRGIDDLSHFG
jgi:hypothetical protein